MPDGRIRIRTVVLFIFTLVLGGLGGCAGADRSPNDYDPSERDEADAAMLPDASEAADAGEGGGGGDEFAGLEAGEWEQMSFDERKRFMAMVVMPAMRPLFQSFDADRFAAVSCKTCHGSGAQAGTFALPNADLPVLSSAALMNPPEEQKAILAFMRETLKPKLAELLGEDSKALKCSTCHTMTP